MFNHDDCEDRSEYRAERIERDDADDLRDAALDLEAERRAAELERKAKWGLFTPGPWTVESTPQSSYQDFIVTAGAGMYCVASVARCDESEANARLIAAAPELLLVVQAGIAMRRAQGSYFKSRTKEALIASKAAEKEFDRIAAEAVAKATGDAA